MFLNSSRKLVSDREENFTLFFPSFSLVEFLESICTHSQKFSNRSIDLPFVVDDNNVRNQESKTGYLDIENSVSRAYWHKSFSINNNQDIFLSLGNRKINSFGASTRWSLETAVEEIVHESTFGWRLDSNHRHHIHAFVLGNLLGYFFEESLQKGVSKEKSVAVDQVDGVHCFVEFFVVVHEAVFVFGVLVLLVVSDDQNLLNQSVGGNIKLLQICFFFFDFLFQLFQVSLPLLEFGSIVNNLFFQFFCKSLLPFWDSTVHWSNIYFIKVLKVNLWNIC